ncbi:MAG: sensor histidine kinase [Chitinophagia bacterium]
MKFRPLDIESEFNSQEQDTILVRKGNQVHSLLLLLSASYSIVYTVVNLIQDYRLQGLINAISVLITGVAFFLYYWNRIMISKMLNLIQLIIVISLMFYYSPSSATHEADSILVFFIPVSLGALIVFQGKERKYGYIIAILIVTLMTTLMFLDKHHNWGAQETYTEGVSHELILNLTGATVATLLEVIFILLLSNRIDEKLLKTNKELDSFVYSVSHDLRSPLLSVRGLLQLSMDEAEDDETIKKYLLMANTSIDHLDDTIREILAYSRNTRIEISYDSFNVHELIEQIYEDLKYAVHQGFVFEKQISGSPVLFSDKARINTVLRNLIGNAVKYQKKRNDQPSYVKTRVESRGNQMIISVEDNGEGISKGNREKVFDMFFRASTSSQGTGLGLYICKEIMLKLHGKIEVKSLPGAGTTMIVTIPNIQ